MDLSVIVAVYNEEEVLDGANKLLKAGKVIQTSAARYANGIETPLSARHAIATFSPTQDEAKKPTGPLQYVKEHPEIIDGVRLGDRIYHSGIQGGIGLWSIITTLFLRLDPQQAEQFAEHVTSGAGLHRGHPLLMLRNPLLGSQRDQYSTLSGREALVAIAIKAWNAWRQGKTLQTLSWRAEGRRAEPFPEAN